MLPNFKHKPDERLYAFLCTKGANTADFHNRSILQHFIGTYSVLREWNNNIDVCNAGLCHGIYLNEFFKDHDATNFNRSTLQMEIGNEAEEMAYIYCFIDRRKFVNDLGKNLDKKYFDSYSGKEISINLTQKKNITELIWANAFEQFYVSGLETDVRSQYLRIFEGSKQYASQMARQAFRELFK